MAAVLEPALVLLPELHTTVSVLVAGAATSANRVSIAASVSPRCSVVSATTTCANSLSLSSADEYGILSASCSSDWSTATPWYAGAICAGEWSKPKLTHQWLQMSLTVARPGTEVQRSWRIRPEASVEERYTILNHFHFICCIYIYYNEVIIGTLGCLHKGCFMDVNKTRGICRVEKTMH